MTSSPPFEPRHRCPTCGDPVDPLQATEPDGGCHRDACRRAARTRWTAETRDVDRRRRAVGRARLRASGIDPDAGPWTVVPANDAGSVALDPAQVDAFRAHLHRVLNDLTVHGRPTHSTPPLPMAPAETAAVRRACATCRGWCCRRGGSHAFLDALSLDRVRRRYPDDSAAELEARYRTHLGATHLDGGCVFQGETGCRLPRPLRSDTCNSWLCPDLRTQVDRWRERESSPRDTRFVAVGPAAIPADPGS